MSSSSATSKLSVNNESDFNVALSVNAAQRVFVLFTGAADPTTGQSWCPDCVDAAPTIYGAFDKTTEPTVLITVPLVRDEYKGNPGHWARVHPGAKLQRIPTLCKWGKSKAVASLIEEDCKNPELVNELVLGDD